MNKHLPVYVTLFAVALFGVYSCGKDKPNTSAASIVGIWQLKQEFSNEGEDTPLEEFPLSACEKLTTLAILKNGRFVEKSYYTDFGTGGECIKDTEDTHGNWEKESNGDFYFTYDQSNILLFNKSDVKLENENLVVLIEYDDPDLGYEIMLKFVYSKTLSEVTLMK
ncbi:hypothetical protein [Aquimarina sediminis]|uniref:hypothetical protein n=1 Tax=Aquimarina sediminis TaxID=2070536 RepID=UPI000CA06902|nr:hypothetical protein [Aquimarina sediminis]